MGKNKKKAFWALLCATAVGASLVACGNGGKVSNKFVTYDGLSITQSGKEGAAIAFPEVKREGYALDGWYTSSDFSGEPVTEAKYKKGVTYYAKWSPVYTVTFDLDGGSFTTSTAEKLPLNLRAGEVVYDHVQEFVPTKGDLQFGNWFIGDDELSQTYTMTQYGVTLTAKYKAAYTVNAYLQNADLDGYTLNTAYLTGYDYVDEEFTVPTIEGYALADSDVDKLPLEINEDSTKNVFDLHFDRQAFNVVYNANYPDGSDDVVIESRYYGAKYDLPTDIYSYDGYRLAGWATVADAEASDIIDGKDYSVTRGTVLYAVWNRGYTDMFGGSDYIYVSPLGDGKATLCRGGIDIDGTYDERRDVYTFAGADGYELRAKVVRSSGTFVYYSERVGSAHYLYTNGAVDEHYMLSLDRTNGVQYSSNAAGDRFEKVGTYSINDMGIYVAEFEDGTSFEFLTGTAMDGSNRAIFRIRSDEYKYEAIGMFGAYFPIMAFDGFGNVLYIPNATAREYYYTYTVSKTEDKEIITLITPSSRMSVRIYDYDGTYGYEEYNAALDNAFTDGNKTLTLDGCSNATYNDGSTAVSGKYSKEQSVFGGYIVTLRSTTRNYLFRAYDEEGENNSVAHKVATLDSNYVEYRYLTNTGSLGNEPYLVVNGTNTAALYERHDGELEQVSSGSFVKQGDSYLYTAIGDIADWSKNKYTALVVNLDTQSSAYKVYYRLSATDADGDIDYKTVYTNTDGTTLTTVSTFAFYNDGKTTILGAINDRTTYIVMNGGTSNLYFAIDKQNHTFEKLSRAPAVFTYMSSTNVSSTGTTLTVTGRGNATDGYEAIHAKVYGAQTTVTHGKYTTANVEGLGIAASVCTFVSDAGEEPFTFKFLLVTMNGNNYFIYHDIEQTVELATYTESGANGNVQKNSTVVLTDKTAAGGANIVEYRNGDDVTDGTCTVAELTVFGEYRFNIYTFTSTDGNTTFDFTLVGNYFRRCATADSYTAADGSTLDVDGRVFVVRYTDGNKNEYDSGYVIVDNILNGDDVAVVMLIDDEEVYFDLDTAAKTFTRRGAEAASYMVFDNTFTTGKTITLDGYGHAKLTTSGAAEAASGTYTQDDGLFTVVIGEDTYAGRLDTVTINNTEYNAFVLSIPGIAGSYLNKADLSVVVLDDAGKVVKYSARGVADNGTYVMIADNTFYYVNGDSTDAAMYTVTASGEVVGANYSATYYADDFSSVVFYRSGALVINNYDVVYYTYDATTDKIFTYTPSNSDKANKYGFVREEFALSGNTITYNDVEYTYFDGKYIEFTDADGNKLEFMPSGAAEFSVEATYTAAGAAKGDNSYAVGVAYDEKGQVHVMLSNIENTGIAGSYDKYNMIASAFLNISFKNKTFSVDRSSMEYAVMAYDYQYMIVIGTYDMNSTLGQLYATMYFGQLNIVGSPNENGVVEYTLSGQINAIAPTGRRSVSFENGTLSRAGFYNNNYGNMFTAEFTGDDGNMYHMNFFLIQSGIDGMCVYMVYSCTRVDMENTVTLSDGTVVYAEKFVYTTGFDIRDNDNNEVKIGDSYFPTLKYNGEIVCAVDWEQVSGDTMRFMSRVFVGDRYADFYYYYTVVKNEDETIDTENSTVVRRAAYNIAAGEGNSVRVIASSSTDVDSIYDLLYMSYNGQTVVFDSCEKTADGTFTATASNGDEYTITFTATEENGETKITATVTPIAE